TAATTQPDGGVGLAATAATLDFNLRSTTVGAPIVDHLDVPVVVTVTTTPDIAAQNPGQVDRVNGRVARPVAVAGDRALIDVAGNAAIRLQGIIGGGGNAPKAPNPGPVTIQLGLTASIPREALDGTGITNLEIGTPFPRQQLGDAAAFQAASTGR